MSEEDIVNFTLRMPAELHAKMKEAAKNAGMTLNAYLNQIVRNDESIVDIEILKKKIEEIIERLEALEKAKK